MPGVTFVNAGTRARGEVVLFTLPPESDLRAWLEEAEVSFSWGPKTIDALEGNYGFHREGLRIDADPLVLAELGVASSLQVGERDLWRSERMRHLASEAYRRWLWAQLYEALDDAGWARAARHMLGLPVGDVTQAQAVAD